MEIHVYQPSFEEEYIVSQEFTVRKYGIEWAGNVKASGNLNISLRKLEELISSSINDACRGREYTKIGKIGDKIKFKIKLRRKTTVFFEDLSLINISVYSDNGSNIKIEIKPRDYVP